MLNQRVYDNLHAYKFEKAYNTERAKHKYEHGL